MAASKSSIRVSTAFQGRLDAAEHLADDIGPLGSWELCGDEIEARLQRRPALRPRQTLDAKRDLGKHRLRYGDVGRRALAASRSTTGAAPFMSADTALVSRTYIRGRAVPSSAAPASRR